MSFFAARKNTVTAQYTAATLPKEFPPTGEITEERTLNCIKRYVWCKANGTVTAGQWVKIDVANMTASTELLVIPTTAVADTVLGLPAGGLAVANGTYFWCQIFGLAPDGLVKTAVAAGDALGGSATAGSLTKLTAAAVVQPQVAQAIAANASGSDAATLVFICSSFNA